MNARAGAGLLLAADGPVRADRAGRAAGRGQDAHLPAADVHDQPQRGAAPTARCRCSCGSDDGEERVKSITAPSVSWNRSAGVTGTYRYYRYLELFVSWHLILSASTTINRSIWFQYDDNRRTPGDQHQERARPRAPEPVLPILRSRPRHDAGGGVELHAAVRRSRARAGAGTSGATSTLGAFFEVRGDRPERHAIEGLPETQDRLSGRARTGRRGAGAPGGGPALRHARAGRLLRARVRQRADRPAWRRGSRARASSASSSGTRACWSPRPPFFRGRPASTGGSSSATTCRFTTRPALGGELLLRGFPGDRFIDKGAWEAEVEQRFKLLTTHIFGVDADWRIDPFVAAGQVYGLDAPWANVRVAAASGCGCGSSPTSSGASTSPTRARGSGRTSCSGIRTDARHMTPQRSRGSSLLGGLAASGWPWSARSCLRCGRPRSRPRWPGAACRWCWRRSTAWSRWP